MNIPLQEVSDEVAPSAHAILICNEADWHQRGGKLIVPDIITLLSLPPSSPELNLMENVWTHLRKNKLCALSGKPTTISSMPARAPGASSSTHLIHRRTLRGTGQKLRWLALLSGHELA